jgi:hypothetical protein
MTEKKTQAHICKRNIQRKKEIFNKAVQTFGSKPK